ncbi:MAG TPA: hydroxymethylbilane synthase [Solirubrobacteraceae bacterium]|nr:hydroxymethylbilane synthase [Solirubrobacteraceae bacterium]
MRLGTRGSALALAQAQLVAYLLGASAGTVEILPIVTRGDRESAGVDDTAGALAGDGPAGEPPPGEDKSRWVSELERALLSGEIDAAVHSAKDVPGELPEGLELVAAPARAAPEDVLCGAAGLDALAPGARVGTSSVRRMAQLRAAREDLDVVAMHGNIDTRLRKLADPAQRLDAIVLARAGLQRLENEDAVGAVLDRERFVPAPGQGTLAIEVRAADIDTQRALGPIGDARALDCLLAERALARELGASCDTPLGAHAVIATERMLLRAWIGLPDGSHWIVDELIGAATRPEALAHELAERLRSVGAGELLTQAERAAS